MMMIVWIWRWNICKVDVVGCTYVVGAVVGAVVCVVMCGRCQNSYRDDDVEMPDRCHPRETRGDR